MDQTTVPLGPSGDLQEENRELRKRLEAAERELARRPAPLPGAAPGVGTSHLSELSRIVEAVGSTLDTELALRRSAEVLLDIFACDRAWMLTPCDPTASEWNTPIKVTTRDWPSKVAAGVLTPMKDSHREFIKAVLECRGPLCMGRAEIGLVDGGWVAEHGIQSQMMTLLTPGLGPQWILGIQQCSYDRVWTVADREVFGKIAERLSMVLSNLLQYKDLQAREERLNLALESVEDGAWDWDIPGKKAIFSKGLCTMLGYELGELDTDMGTWSSRIHPADEAAVERALQLHLAGETEIYEIEHRLRTKSGEWKWVLDRGKVVDRDANGLPLRMTGTHKDIAAEKRTEAIFLRERRLFTGGPCVVFRWVAAEGWPVEYVSPNVAELLGYTAEDFMSGRVSYSEVIHPDDIDWVNAEVDANVGLGITTFEQEYRVVRPSGEVRWLYDFTTVSTDPDAKITHFDGYVLDSTERKLAEERRLGLEAKVQHGQKLESLGVLAGGIAHDFNNLLMGVMGFADLALEDLPPGSPAVSSLQGIQDAAKQASELTQQMLAYSGKGSFAIDALCLNEVVGEMARLLEVTLTRSVRLQFELSDHLPNIMADGSQIRQVIMNLITNAAEAIADNEGVISVKTGTRFCDSAYLSSAFLTQELPEADYVYAEITDTGCGMDEATRDKIFDPFFTTKFTGRGLGLAAVQGIIRGHCGAIRVTSQVDCGTTVVVLFPASRGAQRNKPDDDGQPGWKPTGTVLLVDDEDSVREVGELMLQSIGFEVLVAENGHRALELFEEHGDGITCVLLDLTMPHMGGDEVFRKLREKAPGVRIVITSGYDESDIEKRFTGRELSGFIQKPYGRTRLAKVLRAALTWCPA